MVLFAVNQNKLEPVSETSYVNEAILERKHLQSLLKQHIAPLGDDLMVLCDEFSNWQDSSRRIDILCLTKEAQLAVIELKRTEDGGHMELQAIRYAAMVSSMTLDQAVLAHSHYLNDDPERAKKEILEFLEFDNHRGSRAFWGCPDRSSCVEFFRRTYHVGHVAEQERSGHRLHSLEAI
ncbi:RecB family endonuclease NucS [Bradyrhizobium sp. GM5.1]